MFHKFYINLFVSHPYHQQKAEALNIPPTSSMSEEEAEAWYTTLFTQQQYYRHLKEFFNSTNLAELKI